MTHLVLPFDGWADLRDPKMVPEKKRRPVVEAMTKAGQSLDVSAIKDASEDELEALAMQQGSGVFQMLDVADLAAVALIEKWGYEMPVDLDSIGELPGAVVDALRAAVMPLIGDMFPSFEPDPDPKAPTGD